MPHHRFFAVTLVQRWLVLKQLWLQYSALYVDLTRTVSLLLDAESNVRRSAAARNRYLRFVQEVNQASVEVQRVEQELMREMRRLYIFMNLSAAVDLTGY